MATKKDFEQVIKLVYDEDNNALKVTGGTTINALRDIADVPATDPYPNSQFLGTDATGNLVWKAGSASGLNSVYDDLTPQLGGDLDVNGHAITSTAGISITPTSSLYLDTGADIFLDPAAGSYVFVGQTSGAGLAMQSDLFMLSGSIRSDQANGDVVIAPDGTGSTIINSTAVINGTTVLNGTVTTTNTTPTIAKSFTTTSGKMYWYRAVYTARRTDVAGNTANIIVEGGYYNNAGTLESRGQQKTFLQRSDSVYNGSTSISGSTLSFTCFGQTGHTLDWNVSIQITEV